MKRLLLLSLAILLALSTSCDKEDDSDIIRDFVCFSVRFYVFDSATGANLLDPDLERNLLDQPIAVVYKGVRYKIEEAQDVDPFPFASTRLALPNPLALRWFPYVLQRISGRWEKVYGEYCLEFGEFSPVDDWHGEEFTIEWGDGTSNTVNFDLYIKWKHADDPRVISPLRLDGVPHDGWRIEIRK